jgi:putative nucleotidyltransferase-like protein
VTPRTRRGLLLPCLRNPRRLDELSEREWEQLFREAESNRLSGRVAALSTSSSATLDPPGWLRDRLFSLRALGAESTRALFWELNRIRRAFVESGIQLVALKGAAYAAARVPVAVGRPSVDVDILVPEDRLEEATSALERHGWRFLPLDPYDEQYYRRWMHELPPMVHEHRASALDVHHRILPRTGRLHPDASRLITRAVPSAEEGVATLSPPHMTLHACVHLFQDGEVTGALRDLVDIDGLLRHFGASDGFWSAFSAEAEALGLQRPAYYALRAASRVLDTPVPEGVQRRAARWAPPAIVDAMMTRLLESVLVKAHDAPAPARLALYVRSHWLRMPPLQLAAHLLRKGVRRA